MTSLPTMVPTTRLTLRIGKLGDDLFLALDGRLAELEQHGVVQRLVQAVVLRDLAVAADVGRDLGLIENIARNPGRLAFQCSMAFLASRRSVRPTISLILRKPSCAMISRTSCAMNRMKFTDVLGIAGETFAQFADPAWPRRPGRCSDGRRAS